MTTSVFDLFSIGIGPSSSHTVGPMRAARRFLDDLEARGALASVASITVHLYGSLAATGRSHGTDTAILLALEGARPETVDVSATPARIARIREVGEIALPAATPIRFVEDEHLVFHRREQLPRHPNALRFVAAASSDTELLAATYYSIGGGFIVGDDPAPDGPGPEVPHPFSSGQELLEQCRGAGASIAEVMLANELAFRPYAEIGQRLLAIWQAMSDCIDRGMAAEGLLPGFLKVPRRARGLHEQLEARSARGDLDVMGWLNLFALAVSEENAAGGRVVTAPTNGAAGIVPAVLRYYVSTTAEAGEEAVIEFLLVAGAIARLCKAAASISGAEVGCQGEVGSACAMAAAAFCHVLGGDPAQVENAAEIAIEHHLGLTCDPVGGFVQVPCIERNAVAAVTAVTAARLALAGDGIHRVSLDQALATMRQTGADMKTKYKETSRGGLAVNVTAC